jgi:hypothetical protein
VIIRGAAYLLAATLLTSGRPPAGAHLLFRFSDPRITEASGIARGEESPGVFYVQNDSGHPNEVFAVNGHSGVTAATITVRGARNVDWEDIATAPDRSGTPSLWLADIGDNDATRRSVTVYRMVEPRIDPAWDDRAVRARVAERWRLRYPGGPVDAESLAVAAGGTAYLVTKSIAGATVYRLPPHPAGERVQLVRPVAHLGLHLTGTGNPFGLAGQLVVTGAAISRDGSLFAVRTYSDAWIWRLGRTSLGRAVRRDAVVLPLPREPQGEGITVLRRSLVIDSEHAGSGVYRVPLPASLLARRRPGSTPPPTTTTSSSSSATGTAASGSAVPGWLIVIGAAAVVGAGFAAFRGTRRRR